MSAEKSGAPDQAGSPSVPAAAASEALRDVLAHAQEDTRHKLLQAIQRKEDTGRSLMDVLRQDVDRAMFRSIWEFLNKPIGGNAKSGVADGKEKKVKDLLVEEGLVSATEWEDIKGDETYDPQVGRALIASGSITQEQLNVAMALAERSGQSVWRVLINRGLLSPKQIADARRYGAGKTAVVGDESGIVEMVMRTGLVDREKCDQAVAERHRSGRDIIQHLVDIGAADKQKFGAALAKEFGVGFADLQYVNPDPMVARLLPEHLAAQNRMVPVTASDTHVRLAMANPRDMAARELFQMMVSKEVEPAFAFEKDIQEAINRQSAAAAAPAEPEKPVSAFERIKTRLHASATVPENVGVVNLVGAILEGAVNSRATDIHLEPQSFGLRVRYRIDGMLYDIMNLPPQVMNEVLSRVKVLSGMDITERRHSQDGRFTITVNNKPYDLRAATLPTISGEKLVLRLLNPEDVFLGLRELGFDTDQLQAVQSGIAQPYGMVLVTGPIGSGKTTTLYSMLSEIDILTRNVVTIEDPVEYQLPGINQVQVDTRLDRSFANMLRSVVRQDANVMMVGEIRDEDTAHVAVRAAMTGHQVFSTLHTNDAVGAIDTLRHLKIPPYLMTSALILVVAQRLVRKVCPTCRVVYTPEDTSLRSAGLTPETAKDYTFYRAEGCKNCHQTGYRGRTGIFEVFRLTEKIKHQIVSNLPHDELVKAARADAMQSLLESGLRKVRDGIITIEEVLRVTAV